MFDYAILTGNSSCLEHYVKKDPNVPSSVVRKDPNQLTYLLWKQREKNDSLCLLSLSAAQI